MTLSEAYLAFKNSIETLTKLTTLESAGGDLKLAFDAFNDFQDASMKLPDDHPLCDENCDFFQALGDMTPILIFDLGDCYDEDDDEAGLKIIQKLWNDVQLLNPDKT